jgi:glutaconyl-CoA/methylmalonyl-CoA decarboxylase subunit gamma
MRYHVTFPGGSEVLVELDHLPTGELSVTVDGRKLGAETLSQAASTAMRIDGRVVDLWMEGEPPDVGVIARGRRFYATVESERARALSAALGGKGRGPGEGVVVSPMPGRVLKVLVCEGDEIAAGAPLVVVEAMKMENELCAGRDGKVKKIFVTPGQTVEGGAVLIEVG